MEAFFVHLLKSSCILLLFLGIYHLFLKRETFFTGNRLFLATGLLTSLLLPFITITKTIYVERAPMSVTDMTSIVVPTDPVESGVLFDWFGLLLTIYLLGVMYFGIRLLVQLLSIQNIKKNSEVVVEGSFYHVKTNSTISPFSFFKHIFYYPKQFAGDELNTILFHEKVHAKELHSIDILLTEVVLILLWFNPAIWWYKIMVKQNLEFLADSKTCHQYEDKKQYQYLMLKQITASHKITIANPFFNSLIKKRIIMLNQNQSKRINSLKLLVVLPVLLLFLAGFNTKEVVKFNENEQLELLKNPAEVEFISPIKQEDIEKVSSGFGPAKNPITKQMDFHKGIDLVASTGKDVVASATGTIKESAIDDASGNYILIKHENGYSTKYLHLNDRAAEVGEQVNSGEVIGHVGSTGKSTGPHLHFEILEGGQAIDPQSLVPFKVEEEKTKSIKPVKSIKTKTYKTIELVIDKDTSDEELEAMKKDLAEKDVDFSYTVVHNSNDEIIDITLNISGTSTNGEKFSGNYSSSSENPINTIYIVYDDESNSVSFGNATAKKVHIITDTDGDVNVWSGMDEIGEHEDIIIKKSGSHDKVWISKDSKDIETVEVKKVDGVKKIFVNGKEVSEIHENHFSFTTDDEHHDIRVKVTDSKGKKKNKGKKGKKKYKTEKKSVIIIKDADNDGEIEVIDKKDGFFFMDTDDREPLILIDGKEATKKQLKSLSPDKIATVDVSKGDAAFKKYGEKAKDGVVEVITKKGN